MEKINKSRGENHGRRNKSRKKIKKKEKIIFL